MRKEKYARIVCFILNQFIVLSKFSLCMLRKSFGSYKQRHFLEIIGHRFDGTNFDCQRIQRKFSKI